MPRIYLRPNGSANGTIARLPETFAELLTTADTKLFGGVEGSAKRVFTATGDEVPAEDFDLIEANEVLYVTGGDDWVAPPAAPPPVAATAGASPEGQEATASGGPTAEPIPMVIDAGAESAAVDASAAAAPAVEEEEYDDDDDDTFEVEGIIGTRLVVDTGEAAQHEGSDEGGEGAATTTTDGEADKPDGGDGGAEGSSAGPRREYLVVWRGYGVEDNTWEPADNVRVTRCASRSASGRTSRPIRALSPSLALSHRLADLRRRAHR